eukprot:CAMPEP_0197321444 /NCGR_PEP_ID=MMETSP0891-20130614/65198_1 /TAXON_ID=44058 ORGANISM="Aureoumbra lagunensis, Strain CCMP1510" /NCGR_SAMPLE_ID=MMETSP0891 /ASSEMBLY_ACC=CAM_ASM_000534 /LENGTH=436 /DNA_ID=CAMNT_0042813349 /DNA_START=207 /DNA_END=1517 /DNA_ORIENTATION=+
MEDRALIRGTTRDGGKVFKIFAHPNARWLFYTATQQNLIVLPNDMHSTVRAQYQTFLSMDALKQNNGNDLYLAQRAWIDATLNGKNAIIDVRVWSQSLLAHAILTNICPKFLQLNLDLRKKFCCDIQTFTLGFLSLPIPFRPFGLGRAIAAGERIIAQIILWIHEIRQETGAVAGIYPKEETKFSTNEQDTAICSKLKSSQYGFLGHWMAELERTKNAIKFTDRDIAINMLDMAFAAQDATNSALCFCVAYLSTRPDILQRLKGQAYDAQDVQNFVVNLLNNKPPVPMTLRFALKQTQLTASSGVKIPFAKGELVVHSIEGINKVWENAAKFDLDPFASSSDPGFVDSMVFGSGAHKCPGKSYAIIALQTFVAAFADAIDSVQAINYDPDLMYYPTLFPKKSTFKFIQAASTNLPQPSTNQIIVGDVSLGLLSVSA